jgi:hypothetical protein
LVAAVGASACRPFAPGSAGTPEDRADATDGSPFRFTRDSVLPDTKAVIRRLDDKHDEQPRFHLQKAKVECDESKDCTGYPELFHRATVLFSVGFQGGWGLRLMRDNKNHGVRRIPADAERLSPAREGRLRLALVALLSLATMSILATTNSVSRQHAESLSVQLQR